MVGVDRAASLVTWSALLDIAVGEHVPSLHLYGVHADVCCDPWEGLGLRGQKGRQNGVPEHGCSVLGCNQEVGGFDRSRRSRVTRGLEASYTISAALSTLIDLDTEPLL